jgi:uncharacterized membrane protein YoaK (UPF0700 family)
MLAFEALLLLGALGLLWHFAPQGGQNISTALYGIVAVTALGMGMRNGTIRRLAVPELTTTVLTLTVAAIGFDFSFTRGSNLRWRRRIGSILMMFAGASAGVLLVRHSLVLLLGASAALTILCTLAQLCREETEHEIRSHASGTRYGAQLQGLLLHRRDLLRCGRNGCGRLLHSETSDVRLTP